MKRITITLDRWNDEYRVPGIKNREASAYYTSDEEDAINTCKAMHGECTIKIRKVDEHPEGK